MKKCSKCLNVLDETNFNKAKGKRDGLQSWCKDCNREYQYNRTLEQTTKKREADRRYRQTHKNTQKEWVNNNKTKVLEYQRKYQRDYLRNNPKARVTSNIRYRIWSTLNGSKSSALEQVLGYSITQLMLHLENKFTKGMTWDNYGEWHIDHIIPISNFDYSTVNDIDFKKCWELSNLQPLWACDNLTKSNKINNI